MTEDIKNEGGINGSVNDSQPIVKTNSNESIKNQTNSISTNLSPANSSKYPYSTPNLQTPKSIMNISGTSGAVVNNAPSGMRKVPTVTFSDPKKVVVTPLQQHIQQHKEQQRELKEQKELQKSQRNNSVAADEITGDVAKVNSPKLEEAHKQSPVKFSLASPNNSTSNITSANTSSASIHNENDIKLLKEVCKPELQPQGSLRKDTLSNNETSNLKFQLPQKVGLSRDNSIIAPSPKLYDVANEKSLSNSQSNASRNNSIEENVSGKESENAGKLSPILKQKSPINSVPVNPSNLGTSHVFNSKEMNKEDITGLSDAQPSNEKQNSSGKDNVKNIHPSLPLDDGRLHVLLGACGSLSVLKLKLLIKKLEDVYGGQKKVAIQVIVTDTAERLLYKQHQEKQMMKEQKELKQQKNKEVTHEENIPNETINTSSSPDKDIASPKIQALQQQNHHLLDLQSHVKVWKDSDEWDVWQTRTDPVLHIELRRWADILVVAPMTANTLSKIALGLCDNLLTNVIRAWNPSSPILLAPSMVSQSYNSVITKRHLKFIKDEMPWITVFKPAEKIMGVHGDIGLGGMMDPHEIVNKIVKELGISDDEDEDEDEEEDESDDDEQGESGQIKPNSNVENASKFNDADEKKVNADSNRVALKKADDDDEDDDDDDSDDFDDDDDETNEQEQELKEIIAEQKRKEINAVSDVS
ncbi:hypothetical protein ACO0R3_003195 [Hanseniaspora guilliermondii]